MSEPHELAHFDREILDALPAPAWYADSLGQCHYVNAAWLEFTGGTAHSQLGEGWADGIHLDDLPKVIQEILHSREAALCFQIQYRFRRHDGTYCGIIHRSNPVFDSTGTFSGYIGTFLESRTLRRSPTDTGPEKTSLYRELLSRDREELETRVKERTAELAHTQKVIEEQVRQQKTVALLGQKALTGGDLTELFREAATAVHTTLDVLLCTVFERTADGTEFTRRAISEGALEDTLHSRIPANTASQAGYTLLSGGPVIVEDFSLETRFEVSDAVRVMGAISSISVIIHTKGEPFGILAAYSRLERSFSQDDIHFLQSVANVLAAAIDRRAAEERIRLAQHEAEEASRTKSELLSRMSHELRTPLNAILGFTQVLELDRPNEQQSESIAHISRAGKHLLTLVNQVLDIARSNSNSEPQDPMAALQSIFNRPNDSAASPSAAEFSNPETRAPGSTSVARKKILYIEDQDLNRRLVGRIFEHRPDLELLCAVNGEEAIRLSSERCPDLILLDLNLPDMSGEEVIKRLHAQPALSNIPIVMISAEMMGERVNALLEMGAREFLSKPYRIADFLSVIDRIIPPETAPKVTSRVVA